MSGRQLAGTLAPVHLFEGVDELLLPAADRLANQALQLPDVYALHLIQTRGDVEVKTCLIAAPHGQVVVEETSLVHADQLVLHLAPHLTGEALLREDDHHVHAATERVEPGGHAHLVRAFRPHHRVDHRPELGHRRDEELLLRHAVEGL